MKKQRYDFPTAKVMPRFGALLVCFTLIGIVILVKAGYIMFAQHDYWLTVSERYESRNKKKPATRGNILAADGQILATSLPEYRIYLDPMSWEPDSARRAKDQHFRDSVLNTCIDSIVDGMKRIIPELDRNATKRRILDGRYKKRSHNVSLHSRRVTYIQLTELKKLPLFRLPQAKGGFYTEEFRRRKNPFGRLAARTIGNLRNDNDSALNGLELAFDSVLSGKPGVYHRQKVSNKYIEIIDTLPENGCDVVTTLDVAMQDLTEKVLGEQLQRLEARAGMCILMEVATGDVKAISSLSRLKNGTYAEIDPRAVTNMMEPGSVFKPMSFMVAMDDGFIDLNTTFDTGCGVREMHGRRMYDNNWRKGGDGVLTVPEIIKKSSNVGVSGLIDRAYAAHPERFVAGLDRIGITEDLHLPIPGYQVPRIRPRDGKWYGTKLPWMSIGYETQIPPISTLTFYNGVANGGRLVRPRFVTAVRRGEEVVQEFPVTVLREKMCKPETLRNIQLCLEGVVGKNSGTGKQAYSKYFRVAGKTGTSQIWGKGGFLSNYLISFVGYFPAHAPRYSMIVCIEKTYPAYGGLHCCPVFKKIAETVMARELNSNYTAASDSSANRHAMPFMLGGNLKALSTVLDGVRLPHSAQYARGEEVVWGFNSGGREHIALVGEPHKGGVPSVVGYGLRDAVYRLERLGLKVKAQGVGRVVRQSIAPGTKVRKRAVVELLLSTDEKAAIKAEEAASHPTDTTRKDSTKKTMPGNAPISPPTTADTRQASPPAQPTEKNSAKKTSSSHNESKSSKKSPTAAPGSHSPKAHR